MGLASALYWSSYGSFRSMKKMTAKLAKHAGRCTTRDDTNRCPFCEEEYDELDLEITTTKHKAKCRQAYEGITDGLRILGNMMTINPTLKAEMEEGDRFKWAWNGKKDFDLETLQTMNIQTGGKLSDEDLKEFLPAKKRTSLANKLKRDLGLSSTHKAVTGKGRRMLERFGFTHENYFPDE